MLNLFMCLFIYSFSEFCTTMIKYGKQAADWCGECKIKRAFLTKIEWVELVIESWV